MQFHLHSALRQNCEVGAVPGAQVREAASGGSEGQRGILVMHLFCVLPVVLVTQSYTCGNIRRAK